MSTTSTTHRTPADTPGAAASSGGPDRRGQYSRAPRPQPAQTRPKRRPALIAASVALIATGGLAGVYLLNTSSDAAAVVAVVKPVQQGEVIDRSDLTTARAIKDPAVHTVPADQLDSIVGKRAATDLPAGLLSENSVTTGLVPAQGKSLVGLQLKLSQLPASSLRPGDAVRLVGLPAEGSTKKVAAGQTTTATVVSSHAGDDGQTMRVDVELPSSSAASVATSAAQGRLALIVDSRER